METLAVDPAKRRGIMLYLVRWANGFQTYGSPMPVMTDVLWIGHSLVYLGVTLKSLYDDYEKNRVPALCIFSSFVSFHIALYLLATRPRN